MPTFYTDAEIDVEVSEFIDACSYRDIEEIIEILVEDGHIDQKQNPNNRLSLNELELHENLDAIYGRYCDLSKEEEEIIAKIAKRFKY